MTLGDGEGTRHGQLDPTKQIGFFFYGDRKLLNDFNKVSDWMRCVVQNHTQWVCGVPVLNPFCILTHLMDRM